MSKRVYRIIEGK